MPTREILTVRSGSGIGDNIYLHSIVRHLAIQNPEKIYSVRTKYPDLFRCLPGNVKTEEFSKVACAVVAHYSNRKNIKQTDQYQDMLINAGLSIDLPMTTDWRIQNQSFIDHIVNEANGRPIILTQPIRLPMGRDDQFGLEIMPNASKYDHGLKMLKRELNAYVIMIGTSHARNIIPSSVDLDLLNKTRIHTIMDLGKIAFMTYGQCSQMIPLGEIYNNPVMVGWGHNVTRSKDVYVRTILPEKILHGEKSSYFYDDWSDEKIENKMKDFVREHA